MMSLMRMLLLVLATLMMATSSAFLPVHQHNIRQPPPSSQLFVEKGTVKWFDTKKGFGFITNEASGEDIFVHQSDIQADGFRSLQDGAKVEFEITMDNGKTKAKNVTGPNGEKLPRGFAYKKREE